MQLAGRLLPLVVLLAWNLPFAIHAQEPVYIPSTPAITSGPVLPYADVGTAGVYSGCNTCAQRRGPIRSAMHNHLCNRCQRKGCCGNCQMAAPMVSPCPSCTAAPVMQPSLVPSLTYREVPQTMTRREAYAVQVPVTTYKTVAVTGYQQQIRYRDVPYTVMQKVPQVQYTPTYTTAVSTGCNTCNQGLFTSPAYTTSMLAPYGTATAIPDYSTAGIQQYPYAPQSAMAPQPEAIPEVGTLHVPVPTADPHIAIPKTSSLQNDDWEVIRKSGTVQQTATNYAEGMSTASGKFTGVKSSTSMQARSATDAIIR